MPPGERRAVRRRHGAGDRPAEPCRDGVNLRRPHATGSPTASVKVTLFCWLSWCIAGCGQKNSLIVATDKIILTGPITVAMVLHVEHILSPHCGSRRMMRLVFQSAWFGNAGIRTVTFA